MSDMAVNVSDLQRASERFGRFPIAILASKNCTSVALTVDLTTRLHSRRSPDRGGSRALLVGELRLAYIIGNAYLLTGN